MKPDEALHRKAQASPNSAGSPTRPVGFDWPRLASISSNETVCRRWSYSMPDLRRAGRIRLGAFGENLLERDVLPPCVVFNAGSQPVGQEWARQQAVDRHVVL